MFTSLVVSSLSSKSKGSNFSPMSSFLIFLQILMSLTSVSPMLNLQTYNSFVCTVRALPASSLIRTQPVLSSLAAVTCAWTCAKALSGRGPSTSSKVSSCINSAILAAFGSMASSTGAPSAVHRKKGFSRGFRVAGELPSFIVTQPIAESLTARARTRTRPPGPASAMGPSRTSSSSPFSILLTSLDSSTDGSISVVMSDACVQTLYSCRTLQKAMLLSPSAPNSSNSRVICSSFSVTSSFTPLTKAVKPALDKCSPDSVKLSPPAAFSSSNTDKGSENLSLRRQAARSSSLARWARLFRAFSEPLLKAALAAESLRCTSLCLCERAASFPNGSSKSSLVQATFNFSRVTLQLSTASLDWPNVRQADSNAPFFSCNSAKVNDAAEDCASVASAGSCVAETASPTSCSVATKSCVAFCRLTAAMAKLCST
mmetsp:Transcript_81840/g.171170  ORF Transcript_81840/g.171170 Transcript_81840/m.171170 type:complete len:429 (-) Transcript_81840:4150-5436(-)